MHIALFSVMICLYMLLWNRLGELIDLLKFYKNFLIILLIVYFNGVDFQLILKLIKRLISTFAECVLWLGLIPLFDSS